MASAASMRLASAGTTWAARARTRRLRGRVQLQGICGAGSLASCVGACAQQRPRRVELDVVHRVGAPSRGRPWRPGSRGPDPNGRRRGRQRRAGTAQRSAVPGAGTPPRRRGTSCGPPRSRARGQGDHRVAAYRTGSSVGLPLLVTVGGEHPDPQRGRVRSGRRVRQDGRLRAVVEAAGEVDRGVQADLAVAEARGVGGAAQSVDEVAGRKVRQDRRQDDGGRQAQRRRGTGPTVA